MPTYSVRIRYDDGAGRNDVTGTVESGPGAYCILPNFLAVDLHGGQKMNIAIDCIYWIEILEESADVPASVDRVPDASVDVPQGKSSDDGTYRSWSGSDVQPMEPVNTVWDKEGHRWEHNDGLNLWESDAQQYPEPWAGLLSYYGPVTDRFVS